MVISVLSSQETEFIKDNIADLGKASVKSSVFDDEDEDIELQVTNQAEQQDVLVVGDDPLVGDDQPLGVDKG